jgi:hypothetical protein
MTETEETYHHWRVFAGTSAGVCVLFDREALIAALSTLPGIRTGSVDYQRLRDARRPSVHLLVDELPFIKRAGFIPEREFRLLYTSSDTQLRFLDIPIPLDCIVEVRLSPWLNSRLRKCLKDTIHNIQGCRSLVIHRSTLIGNSSWKKLADRAI